MNTTETHDENLSLQAWLNETEPFEDQPLRPSPYSYYTTDADAQVKAALKVERS